MKKIGIVLVTPGYKLYEAVMWVKENGHCHMVVIVAWILFAVSCLWDETPENVWDVFLLVIFLKVSFSVITGLGGMILVFVILFLKIITTPCYWLYERWTRSDWDWKCYYIGKRLMQEERLEKLLGEKRAREIAQKTFDKKWSRYCRKQMLQKEKIKTNKGVA